MKFTDITVVILESAHDANVPKHQGNRYHGNYDYDNGRHELILPLWGLVVWGKDEGRNAETCKGVMLAMLARVPGAGHVTLVRCSTPPLLVKIAIALQKCGALSSGNGFLPIFGFIFILGLSGMNRRQFFAEVWSHPQPFRFIMSLSTAGDMGSISTAAKGMWFIQQFDSLLHLGRCKEYLFMANPKVPRTISTRKSTTSKPAFAPENGNSSTIDLEAEIRRRAYELYLMRGCTPGQENDDWFVAEREIRARYNQLSASASA